jgi:chemotaxis signal transduction protein
VVDSVDSVLSFSKGEISPFRDGEISRNDGSISGIAKKDGQLILILDLRTALAPVDDRISNDLKETA